MRRVTCLLLAAAMLCAAPASAQLGRRPASATEERREALFREGKALARQGRWAEAAERFREVIAIRSAPKALLALAVAEEAQGHLLAAKEHYTRARDDAVAQRLADDREAAERALEALGPRIPRVTLKLPEGAPAVRVLVDEKEARIASNVVEVDPGAHTIVVRAEGREPFHARVRLGELERTEIAVTLAPLERPVERPVVAVETPSRAPPIGAIVTGGLGLAAAGGGVALLVIGQSEEDDVRSRCGGDTCPKQLEAELQPKLDAASTKIIAGDVLLGAGIAALVAGGVWWIVSATRSPAKPTSASVAIVPARGGAWATIGGSF